MTKQDMLRTDSTTEVSIGYLRDGQNGQKNTCQKQPEGGIYDGQ